MKRSKMVSLDMVTDILRLAASNACPNCYSSDEPERDEPERDEDGSWWHPNYDNSGENRECDASDVHEALRDIHAEAQKDKSHG